MALALFDLDNTLLAGDSDYLWGVYLSEIGVVDGEAHQLANAQFYEDYHEGRLDIMAFLAFALRPLAENEPQDLRHWREDFLRRKIDPIITPAARALVEKHRAAGDTLMVITATNSFITGPIAERFGIPNLIATEPEQRDGRFTGRVQGTPSFREGKVARLQQWLDEHQMGLEGSWFYSDSHNDLPLLEQVANPVAVDPDDTLAHHAQQHQWPIISLRDRDQTSTPAA